jgi:putative PIN family toxin of toxin-antitoxin system
VAVPAVFDTVTLLQAAANPAGPAGACLRLVTEKKVILHLSEDGLAELADVLSHPKIRKKFSLLTDEHVSGFIRGLRALAEVLPEVPSVFRYVRDPDDEHVLNLAIATRATYIVTRDNDLLDLRAEDNADGLALKALHPTIEITDPVSFLTQAEFTVP